jgi:hypothetical protein
MPQLTCKRVNDLPVTWHIHYAGVRVGVIVERSGAPPSSDQWQWYCGFTGRAKAEAFERYLKSGSGHAFANKRLW